MQTVLKEMAIPFEGRGGVDLWQGVAAKLVIGSLYYLRDGEVPQAMSRLGSNKRGQVLRHQLDQIQGGRARSICSVVQECSADRLPMPSHPSRPTGKKRDGAQWSMR